MAKTISEAFRIFLSDLTPTQAERDKAAQHRESVEEKLKSAFSINRFWQSGSFSHGTGVRSYSDVDYFASMPGVRPLSSTNALNKVRDALKQRFPFTPVRVSRPAVVGEFGAGAETYEIVPAYLKSGTGNSRTYYIAGASGSYITSAPDAHLQYVNEANATPKGLAKNLARLLKAWKYYRGVPISSFYLEMRAAEYAKTQSSIIYDLDLLHLLKRLQAHQLVAMNDPKNLTSRIYPCFTDVQKTDALSKLDTAATRAEKAVDARKAGKIKEAFDWWDRVFNCHFPAYY